MEVKNGIIIDGVLHKAVQYKINCKRCSLLSMCQKFNVVCAIIGCEAFVNCGKVTDINMYVNMRCDGKCPRMSNYDKRNGILTDKERTDESK